MQVRAVGVNWPLAVEENFAAKWLVSKILRGKGMNDALVL